MGIQQQISSSGWLRGRKKIAAASVQYDFITAVVQLNIGPQAGPRSSHLIGMIKRLLYVFTGPIWSYVTCISRCFIQEIWHGLEYGLTECSLLSLRTHSIPKHFTCASLTCHAIKIQVEFKGVLRMKDCGITEFHFSCRTFNAEDCRFCRQVGFHLAWNFLVSLPVGIWSVIHKYHLLNIVPVSVGSLLWQK